MPTFAFLDTGWSPRYRSNSASTTGAERSTPSTSPPAAVTSSPLELQGIWGTINNIIYIFILFFIIDMCSISPPAAVTSSPLEPQIADRNLEGPQGVRSACTRANYNNSHRPGRPRASVMLLRHPTDSKDAFMGRDA